MGEKLTKAQIDLLVEIDRRPPTVTTPLAPAYAFLFREGFATLSKFWGARAQVSITEAGRSALSALEKKGETP